MHSERRIWLINNEASGSNDTEALRACEDACESNGLAIAHRTTFPSEELPNPAMLDAAEVDHVVVYAGDGTVNAALRALQGWSGSVLVLPGGTMNLLYHRLFANASLEEAVGAVANGSASAYRPNVIRCGCGTAYAGLLAGPGTAWNDVREAMRFSAPLEMAAESRAALEETLEGTRVRCENPDLGRREGYPLVLLSPEGSDIVVDAYYAEETGEYVQQALALVRREFRDGPHDRLGQIDAIDLVSVGGESFGLLLDGEPCDASARERFALVPSEVDLLATRTDG